jgi:hypothetical protein
MKKHAVQWLAGVTGAALGLAVILVAPAATQAKESVQPPACPTTSTNTYVQGGVYQYDLDNPVRWAEENADKNLEYRSLAIDFSDEENPVPQGLVDYGPSSDHALPPQLGTLFEPVRVPPYQNLGKAFSWLWAPSPDPGVMREPNSYDTTIAGMVVTHGEELHTPRHSRNLGAPFGKSGAVVLYASEYSITLKFTREDSVARGYTVHIINVCTDPNLLALYRSLDNADRNSIGPGSGNHPRDLHADYNLPGLTRGQVFGTAYGNEIYVAIRDEGSFLDPRSKRDWWRIR